MDKILGVFLIVWGSYKLYSNLKNPKERSFMLLNLQARFLGIVLIFFGIMVLLGKVNW
jgi:hypothetical protein